MTDYIERDELVSYFKEIATETLRDGSVQCVLGAGVIAHMIVEIKEFPAADVRPVKRGRWISDDETGVPICSVCYSGKPTKCVCTSAIEHKLGDSEIRFCYFCGADMRTEFKGFVPLDNAKLEDADFSLADRIREEGGDAE